MQSGKHPLKTILICTIFDKDDNALGYHTLDLQRVVANYTNGVEIQKRQFIEKVPANADRIRFYFHNEDMELISVTNLKLSFYGGEMP